MDPTAGECIWAPHEGTSVAVAALNHGRDPDVLLEARIRDAGQRLAGAIARSPVFAATRPAVTQTLHVMVVSSPSRQTDTGPAPSSPRFRRHLRGRFHSRISQVRNRIASIEMLPDSADPASDSVGLLVVRTSREDAPRRGDPGRLRLARRSFVPLAVVHSRRTRTASLAGVGKLPVLRCEASDGESGPSRRQAGSGGP